MRDAKALFLVDDDKTQFLELGLFRQDRMRADDNIDLAALKPFAGFLHFLGRYQS